MLTIEEIMQRDVFTLAPELTLREAVGVLTEAGVTGAPVLSNGRVVGVMSATDILEFEGDSPGVPVDRGEPATEADWEETEARTWDEGGAPLSLYFSQIWEPQEVDVLERMETPDSPEWDILDQHTVGDIMSRNVIALPPGATVQEAARTMIDADIRRVLVSTDEQLLGIVTMTDVVRAVAEGRLGG